MRRACRPRSVSHACTVICIRTQECSYNLTEPMQKTLSLRPTLTINLVPRAPLALH